MHENTLPYRGTTIKKKALTYISISQGINWRFPTFPGKPSIIGAIELNYRVRDGNGCDLYAIVTRIKNT